MHILRNRTTKGGVCFDIILLLLFVILIYKFIERYDVLTQFRTNQNNDKGSIGKIDYDKEDFRKRKPQRGDDYNENVLEKIGVDNSKAASAVDSRIQRLPDPRSTQCRTLQYDKAMLKNKATLVLAFTDYELEDAKVTITSVLYNQEAVDRAALAEIILVDAGSSLEHIRDEADKYVEILNSQKQSSPETPSPPARLIRVETHKKTGKSEDEQGQHYRRWPRTIGMRASKTDIVVFLDPGVVVGRGWLAPLLTPLASQSKDKAQNTDDDKTGQLAIVEAHLDRITSPINLVYEPTPDEMVAVPSWSMSIKMKSLARPSPKQDSSALYTDVPATRGNAFAVQRSIMKRIGGLYDNVLDVDGGGEHLELSLRVWMCGSGIKQSICSRVGVPEVDAERKIVSPHNNQHIADVWFGTYSYLVYQLAGGRHHDDLAAAGETVDEVEQRQRLRRQRDQTLSSTSSSTNEKCRDFNWYVRNAAFGSVPIPATTEPLHFGVLQVQSGMCAYVDLKVKDRLLLGECKPNEVPQRQQLFEFTKDRRLVTNTGLCLSVVARHYVAPVVCSSPLEKHQLWTFRVNGGDMVNDKDGQCLTHVSDPDQTYHGRQIAMAQGCRYGDAEEKKYEHFKKWHFILP